HRSRGLLRCPPSVVVANGSDPTDGLALLRLELVLHATAGPVGRDREPAAVDAALVGQVATQQLDRAALPVDERLDVAAAPGQGPHRIDERLLVHAVHPGDLETVGPG